MNVNATILRVCNPLANVGDRIYNSACLLNGGFVRHEWETKSVRIIRRMQGRNKQSLASLRVG